MKSDVEQEDWSLYQQYVQKRLDRTRKNIEYIERSKDTKDEKDVSESEYYTTFLENLRKEERDIESLLGLDYIHFGFVRSEVGYLCDHLKCMQKEGNDKVPWATPGNKSVALFDTDVLLRLLKSYA